MSKTKNYCYFTVAPVLENRAGFRTFVNSPTFNLALMAEPQMCHADVGCNVSA
jgi:hypothetical protein